jgi:hypothetical protein
MKTIQKFGDFNSINEELSPLQKEYREFFRLMLDKYGVTSPAKLSEKKKKEFFNEISKKWEKGVGPRIDLDEFEEEIEEDNVKESKSISKVLPIHPKSKTTKRNKIKPFKVMFGPYKESFETDDLEEVEESKAISKVLPINPKNKKNKRSKIKPFKVMFGPYKESVGTVSDVYYDIKDEYSSATVNSNDGFIDLGHIDEVSDTNIKNLEQTYKNSQVVTKNGRVLLYVEK